MEAYENYIACSRPRVRTGIRARFFLWRRRPAPSKEHRPIATPGRDGSGRKPTDRRTASHTRTGHARAGGNPVDHNPVGRNRGNPDSGPA